MFFFIAQRKVVNGLQWIVADTHAIMNGIRSMTFKSKTNWKKFLEPEIGHSLDTFERAGKTMHDLDFLHPSMNTRNSRGMFIRAQQTSHKNAIQAHTQQTVMYDNLDSTMS